MHLDFVAVEYPVHEVPVNDYFLVDLVKLNEVLMRKINDTQVDFIRFG